MSSNRIAALEASDDDDRGRLIQKVHAAIIVHDGEGRILSGNALAEAMLGLTHEQFAGKSATDPIWHFFAEDGSVLPKDCYPASMVLASGRPIRDYVVGIKQPEREDLVWGLANAEPEFDADGKITRVIVSFVDITERKRVEEDRLVHMWFLESLDRINRATQGTSDQEYMLDNVLDTVLGIFNCDRTFLIHPCDPEAPTWSFTKERYHPEFSRRFAHGARLEIPAPIGAARVFRAIRETSGPVRFGHNSKHPLPWEREDPDQAMLAMAVYPKESEPYLFGLHQCSHARGWTREEERLFQEIGRRLADTLTMMQMFGNLRRKERKLKEAQRIGKFGYWDRDLIAGTITMSEEACRIFGLPPHEFSGSLSEWHLQWLRLLHPDDQTMVAQAFVDALEGGPRYDVEYRVVQPDGEVRIVHSRAEVQRDANGRPQRAVGTMLDVTDAKRTEEKLRRLNRELRAISNCNQALMRAEDETELLNSICRIVCEDAGYRFVWAGFPEDDAEKTFRYAGWGGVEEGYLKEACITWGDTERGRGPSGVAMRTGKSVAITDFATSSEAAPWRDIALQRGYRSSVALPLKDEGGSTFGVLCIYSEQPGAFTPEETRLLEELAGDLAFGITVLRSRVERRRTNAIMQARLRLLEFAASHSLDEILARTLDEIEVLTGSTVGFYHFVEADEKTLTLQQWSTNTLANMCTVEQKGHCYNIADAGVWVDCVAARAPVIHNDYLSLSQRRGMPDGHALVVREAVTPIFRDSRIVAIVGVGNKDCDYDEGDIEIISQLSDLSWDIAGRKRAELAVKESEERLRIALDAANFGTADYYIDTSKLVLDTKMKQMLGLEPEDEPSHKQLIDRILADDREHVRQAVVASFSPEGNSQYEIAFRVTLPDGTLRWHGAKGRTYFEKRPDGSRRPVRITGVESDITERKRAEEALRESEARQAFLLRLSDTLGPLNDPGEIQYQLARVLGEQLAADRVGYAEAQSDGKTMMIARDYANGLPSIAGVHSVETLGTDSIAKLRAGYRVVYNNTANAPELSEYEKAYYAAGEVGASAISPMIKCGRLVGACFVHHRNPHRWTAEEVALIDDAVERTWQAVERTRAETALHAERSRLQAIIDTIPVGFLIIEANGTMSLANEEAQHIWASPTRLEEIKDYSQYKGYRPDTGERLKVEDWPGLRALMHGHTVLGQEVAIERFDGTKATALFSAAPVKDVCGATIAAVVAIQDITGRKQREIQVQHLLREVNHRAKNMLTVVQAIAWQTVTSAPEDFILRFSERLQALAASQDLLVKSEWRGVDIEALMHSQLAHFVDLIGVRIMLEGPALKLSASASQSIGMAIHELSTNASKYGALSIETGQVAITWGIDCSESGDNFALIWSERDGPPVRPPERRGFGHKVLVVMPELELDASIALNYAPEGMNWKLVCPASKILDAVHT